MTQERSPRPEARVILNVEKVASMFQALQSARRAVEKEDPESHRANLLMEFVKLKPPVFDGSSEPKAAKRWLKTVKKKLKMLGVPHEYRVGFATYLFEGSAEEWWDLQMNDYDVPKVSWDEFETLFQESYVLKINRQEMIAEFGQLVQRDMTVEQYHARFVELSQYDRGTGANPVSRCKKFRGGLRRKIRSSLAPLPLTDFTELVAAAQRVEAELFQKNEGHKASPGSNRKRGKKNWLQHRNSPGSGSCRSSASPGSGRYQPYACYVCGQTGHKQRSCPRSQQQSPLAYQGQ